MRLRASFTIENAVLIPLFTLIIVALILFTFTLHDRVVIKNVIFQSTILSGQTSSASVASYNGGTDLLSRSELAERSEAYLEEKTIIAKDLQVSILSQKQKESVSVSGGFEGLLFQTAVQSVQYQYIFSANKNVTLIRITRCIKGVTGTS